MSGSHCPATLGTAAAGLNTFTHAAHLLTAFGACLAQFGARATNGQVLGGLVEHHSRGRPADLGATHHQAHVLTVPRSSLLRMTRHS
jgi:hypothetical protein